MAAHEDPLEAGDWGEVLQRLTLYTCARLGRRGTIKDAEDLAVEAITQFLDPSYNWDRGGRLEDVLGSIVNGLVQNLSRRHFRRKEVPDDEHLHSAKAPDPSSEERVATADLLRQKMDMLLERVSGDPVVEGIVLLELDGVDEPKEQANRLKVSSQNLYNARRRLKSHVDAVNGACDEQED